MTAEEFVQSIKPEKVTYNDMGTVYTTYEYTEQQLIDAFNAGEVEANRWHNLVENPNDSPKVEMDSVLLKLIANKELMCAVLGCDSRPIILKTEYEKILDSLRDPVFMKGTTTPTYFVVNGVYFQANENEA